MTFPVTKINMLCAEPYIQQEPHCGRIQTQTTAQTLTHSHTHTHTHTHTHEHTENLQTTTSE